MTGLIDRARGRFELATLLALTVWITVRYSQTTAFRLPFLVAWVALVIAFFIGREGGPPRVGLRDWRSIGRTLGLGVTSAVVAGLIAHLGFGAPRSIAAEFALLISVAAWVGVVFAPQRRHSSWRMSLIAAEAVATWPLLDSYLAVRPPGLYDFHVYIGAGQRLLAGGQPYTLHPIAHLPPSPYQDAFPYPPVLLPVFAVASKLPLHVAEAAWVVVLVVSAALALRLFGLRWGWVAVLLAFPPLVKGIDSGNIAYLGLPLFALAPYVGSALVLPVLLKVQFAVPMLWLIRERRWRALLAGIGLTVGLSLITLPLVGVQRWVDWVRWLGYRAESQVNVPILYGLSLAQYLPAAAFVALSVIVVFVALRLRGRQGLAGLGLATIVASPTLWPHGFLLALPAVLALDSVLLWPALTIGVGGAGLWALVVFGALGLILGSPGRLLADEPMHPFGGTAGPWAAAERNTKSADPGVASTTFGIEEPSVRPAWSGMRRSPVFRRKRA